MFKAKKKNQSFSSKIKGIFKNDIDLDALYEDLEDLLIEGDIGAIVSYEIVEKLKEHVASKKIKDNEAVFDELKAILHDFVLETQLVPEADKVNVYLVLGVNGVGKTTTIAKLANYFNTNGLAKDCILAAGDTFRAAAIEQLSLHAQRLGLRVVAHQSGSDPAAVIYDAVESAHANKVNLVLADTAGRMHSKQNLVNELEKIVRVVSKKSEDAIIKKILVIDSTTGQNGIAQAETFNDAVGIDAVILTKYDSKSKAGIAVSISKKLGIPVAYVGTGESYDSLIPFSKDDYIDEILGK
ncbi:MAG: signal recognition particle-docking protein FtsY [Spirochaetales bacterium]|nr:signal recognition particle-docking protein FtsY [Spirochaetales bacterium]